MGECAHYGINYVRTCAIAMICLQSIVMLCTVHKKGAKNRIVYKKSDKNHVVRAQKNSASCAQNGIVRKTSCRKSYCA